MLQAYTMIGLGLCIFISIPSNEWMLMIEFSFEIEKQIALIISGRLMIDDWTKVDIMQKRIPIRITWFHVKIQTHSKQIVAT